MEESLDWAGMAHALVQRMVCLGVQGPEVRGHVMPLQLVVRSFLVSYCHCCCCWHFLALPGG